MTNVSEPIPVWIDCDPGHDDAFALLLATHSPEINLLGISIEHGNDEVEHCGLNAKRFLWLCGVSGVPVYLGAERPLLRIPKYCPEIHGISGEQGVSGLCGYHFPDEEIFSNPEYRIDQGHGVLEMMKILMNYSKKVTIVATGAQTNLALLIRMFPHVIKNIKKIVFMGGAIGLGNTGVAAEFNIEIDPEAAHIVFHSGIPLVMIPLEVTHTVLVTDDILNHIKKIGEWKNEENELEPSTSTTSPMVQSPGCHEEEFEDESTEWQNVEMCQSSTTPFANCCYQLLTFFKSTYKHVFSFPSPPLHDPCTIFYLTNPDDFEVVDIFVDVETSSEKCLGRTLCDIHGVLKKKPNVLVCTRVNTKKFWQRMLRCIQLANIKSPLNRITQNQTIFKQK